MRLKASHFSFWYGKQESVYDGERSRSSCGVQCRQSCGRAAGSHSRSHSGRGEQSERTSRTFLTSSTCPVQPGSARPAGCLLSRRLSSSSSSTSTCSRLALLGCGRGGVQPIGPEDQACGAGRSQAAQEGNDVHPEPSRLLRAGRPARRLRLLRRAQDVIFGKQ